MPRNFETESERFSAMLRGESGVDLAPVAAQDAVQDSLGRRGLAGGDADAGGDLGAMQEGVVWSQWATTRELKELIENMRDVAAHAAGQYEGEPKALACLGTFNACTALLNWLQRKAKGDA